MASEMIVQQSGPVYLVGSREKAIIVDLDEGTISPILDAQSAVAHLIVSEPWVVIEDRRSLPGPVLAAIAQFEHD